MSEAPLNREQLRAARLEQWRAEAAQDSIENWIDTRFAPLQTGTGSQATSLRALAENPPPELLIEVARRGDTPAAREGAQKLLTARKLDEVYAAFKEETAEFYDVPANYTLILRKAAQHSLPGKSFTDEEVGWALLDAGELTVANLQAAYRELRDSGRLIVPRGVVRELRSEQLDAIVAAAEVEGADKALELYVRESFGGKVPSFPEGVRGLVAAYPEMASKAARFVWEAATADFIPSQAWSEFVAQRTAHRRVVTFVQLKAAWEAFKSGEHASAQRNGEAPITVRDTADMTDTEIEDAIAKARREHARSNPFARYRS